MADPKEPAISASFISHLRQSSRITCPMVGCEDQYPAIDDRIRDHFKSKHGEFIQGKDFSSLIRDVKKGRIPGSRGVEPLSIRDPGGGGSSGAQGMPDEAGPSAYKRRNSPGKQPRPQSNSPPRRSRARPDPDFTRRAPQQGKLWHPEEDPSSSPYRTKQSSSKPLKHTPAPKSADAYEEDSEALRLIKQPETRPISQEQLVAEVKGIYAGLMMVESKCIEVDNAQSSNVETKLNNEQWQALIALHRTLLHEHHDFFLASQHPSASQALKRLASKYAMPARMWRHGIHSFLELLRHRLPESLEHMLTFIYLAYSMMALLYETVPAFEDTWIECLGDLGRYRMAIEDEDIRDREVWTSVSRHWYSKASDKAPTTGRLYHHLAILARPNALQQLFFYTKSLCVPIPFGSAKESIMTLFDPILGIGNYHHNRLIPIDVAFVKTHGILFSHKKLDIFRPVASEFLGALDNHIGRIAKRWMEAGYYIAIANCCALLSYGKDDNIIMRAIQSQGDEKQDSAAGSGADTLNPSRDFEDALYLAMGTHEVVFKRCDDANVLPYTHVIMVFIFYLIRFPNVMEHLEPQFPWKLLSILLNGLLATYNSYDRIRSAEFPRESNDPPRPVPEDFALEGLLFVDSYFPSDWFVNDKIDDDEKYFEMASMTDVRKERILWLGYKIAQSGRGLTYDEGTNTFGVFPQYEKEMDAISRNANSMNISDEAGDAMDIDEAPATTTR
ncbi:hypothetical protein F5B22DRAFT_643204 [Xylaria bambusicola]|uniref:uncharacterized protein n=1 Tax=Xylaria bambusicola TaxID=326684 RepID=UPI0020081996|nr:uncharacterized protein F5B22DRAFT_643204 [Xylaria bambusicola]KAI0522182.1 hypothetical protein F5B22DRAFT_643204 [Xylaria bambusicola]